MSTMFQSLFVFLILWKACLCSPAEVSVDQLIRKPKNIQQTVPASFEPQTTQTPSTRRWPAFYYKDYYDPSRSLKVDEEDPMETSASNQVKYSYPAKKLSVESNSQIELKEKSPRSFSPSRSIESVKNVAFQPSHFIGNAESSQSQARNGQQNTLKFSDSKRNTKNIKSNTIENILGGAQSIKKAQLEHQQHIIPTQAPVQYAAQTQPQNNYQQVPTTVQQVKYLQQQQQQPQSKFDGKTGAFSQLNNQPLHIQNLIKNYQAHHAQNLINPVQQQYEIRSQTYQSNPGAPAFNIPVPVTHNYLEPYSSGSEALNNVAFRKDDSPSSYIQYDGQTHAVHGAHHQVAHTQVEEETSFMDSLLSPFREANARISEFFEPMMQPFYDMQERIRSRLEIPNDVFESADRLSESVNNYVSRTGTTDAAPLGLVAVLALAGTGLIVYALTLNTTGSDATSISFGRSLDEGVLKLLGIDFNDFQGKDLPERFDTATKWTDTNCAKKMFCSVLSYLPEESAEYPYETKLANLIDRSLQSNDTDFTIKRAAKDIMKKVRKRSCRDFKCSPESFPKIFNTPVANVFKSMKKKITNKIELEDEE